jgi:hypothetical protein
MRVILSAGLLGLLACYDPHPHPGAPCSDQEPCPHGQSCIASMCRTSEIVDAQSDTTDGPIAAADRDGDGVPDTMDNCGDAANPDQGNEDGDRFGDVCDPCPIEANNTPSDPDGDGVADGCDPRPGMAGDKIVLFEGFHHGVPFNWRVIGTAQPVGDDVSLTSVGGNHTAIVPPGVMLGNGTLTTSLVADATVGDFDSAITVTMPYNPDADQGIFCELYAPMAGSSSGRYVSLWDSPAQLERGKRAFAWATGTPYRVALTRTGTSYACSVTPVGGQPQVAAGSSNSMPGGSAPSIAMYGANAHAAWMLVVSSP